MVLHIGGQIRCDSSRFWIGTGHPCDPHYIQWQANHGVILLRFFIRWIAVKSHKQNRGPPAAQKKLSFWAPGIPQIRWAKIAAKSHCDRGVLRFAVIRVIHHYCLCTLNIIPYDMPSTIALKWMYRNIQWSEQTHICLWLLLYFYCFCLLLFFFF